MTPFFARNHYEMLQVGRNASADELTRAFRKLAKEYHPDVAQQKLTAANAFHRIRESYEVLSNPQKRREYDQRLKRTNGVYGSRAATATANPRPRARPRRPQAPRPKPLRHNTSLDLEASISVKLPRIFTGGEQTVFLDKAPVTRHPLRARSVRVQIPPFCVEGSKIEVPLHGRHDPIRSEAGNLYLKVDYAPYENFQIRGSHLYTSISIFPWDAAMGAVIPIESPEGITQFEVPAGTHQWRTFCVQDKGLPQKGGGRGHLYVYVKIQSVSPQNDKQLALWKALKESYKEEGRST